MYLSSCRLNAESPSPPTPPVGKTPSPSPILSLSPSRSPPATTMSQPFLLSRSPAASASSRRLFRSLQWSLQPCRCQSLHTRRLFPQSLAERSRQHPTQSRSPVQPSPSISRSYHSKNHPDPPPHEYSNSQTTILSAALSHVPDHGFTREALTLGARDAGFLDVSVQLFPRGELDLIFFWLASRRGLLRGKVENGLFENHPASPSPRGLSVEDKVRILLLERLRMNAGIRHQWQDVSPPPSLENVFVGRAVLTLAGPRAHVLPLKHPPLPLGTPRSVVRYPLLGWRCLGRCRLVYETLLCLRDLCQRRGCHDPRLQSGLFGNGAICAAPA